MFKIPYTPYVVIRLSSFDHVRGLASDRGKQLDDLQKVTVDAQMERDRLKRLITDKPILNADSRRIVDYLIYYLKQSMTYDEWEGFKEEMGDWDAFIKELVGE